MKNAAEILAGPRSSILFSSIPGLLEHHAQRSPDMIEFYGMTETAFSPLACNPLPPRARKPGSVGIPIDLDVAIMDDRKLWRDMNASQRDGGTAAVTLRGMVSRLVHRPV